MNNAKLDRANLETTLRIIWSSSIDWESKRGYLKGINLLYSGNEGIELLIDITFYMQDGSESV